MAQLLLRITIDLTTVSYRESGNGIRKDFSFVSRTIFIFLTGFIYH